jgi:hypothetical protein
MTTLGEFQTKDKAGTLTDDDREAWELLKGFHLNDFGDLEVSVTLNVPAASHPDVVDEPHEDAQRRGIQYEASRKDGKAKKIITKRLHDLALRHGAQPKS